MGDPATTPSDETNPCQEVPPSWKVALVVLHLTIFHGGVGVSQNDRVEIIANDQGNRTTPLYVSSSENERLIGDAAKNQTAMNPHNTHL